jgi:hypothetical protein
VTSYVNSSDEEVNYWEGGLGGIMLTTGPHHNTFSNIQLNNADVAITFNVSKANNYIDWQEATAAQSVGNNNRFEECEFSCEIGISLSDSRDETGYAPEAPKGGSLIDGSDLDVKDNEFINCDFTWSSEAGEKNAFFHSAREASGNTMSGCTFFAFPRYVIGSSRWAANNTDPDGGGPLTAPVPILNGLGEVPGFSFDGCTFWNPDGQGNEVFPDYGGNNNYLDL